MIDGRYREYDKKMCLALPLAATKFEIQNTNIEY